MSTSTLDPDNDLTVDRQLGVGHDDSALGPSDSSDSGSDVKGLFGGDSDTDRRGTGERATVEMPDEGQARQDIGVDHIENIPTEDAHTARSSVEGGQPSGHTSSEMNEAPENIVFEDETR
ncbi:MAG TPA: hypothetical protein VN361_05765 [Oxalicibacterium sp.]|nr:hypothetical protein [Oxalicibacterium sp.]